MLEEAWLAARAGEHGYLAGKDAEVVACDALIVPVVTASPDWAAVDAMITLVLDAYGPGAHGSGAHAQPGDGQRRPGRAWAGGCDKRPAQCDVHHIKHLKDGGPTSVKDCILLCQYHHDICIHRWGWDIELLPDGSVRCHGPDGEVLRSHGPPPAQAA